MSSAICRFFRERHLQNVKKLKYPCTQAIASLEMSNLDLQKKLISWGLLDPPADGVFGAQSGAALDIACKLRGLTRNEGFKLLNLNTPAIALNLTDNLASRIVKYMQAKEYFVALGDRAYNIVYLEGGNEDGSVNNDAPNLWNDLRIVIEVPTATGIPVIADCWNATSEPGDYYTQNPMNPDGAFRIAFGQYKAWLVGKHHDHDALVQCGEIRGYRDANKDYSRAGDRLVSGSNFGVNQHWGYDMSEVGRASAGCLVGKTRSGHQAFMKLIKRDRRYQVSNNYVFMTTIIAGDDLAQLYPVT